MTRITNKQYYILNYNNISLPTNISYIETQNVLITIIYRHKCKYTNEHVYFQVHIKHSNIIMEYANLIMFIINYNIYILHKVLFIII